MRVNFLLPSSFSHRLFMTSLDPYSRLFSDDLRESDDVMATNSPTERPDYDYDYNAGGHGTDSSDNAAEGMNLNAME